MGKVKEPVAIIGEGITEKYYIESLKDLRELSPKPKFFKTTNATAKEYENKIKESIEKGYTKIYCLFDMDTHSKDPKYIALKGKYHNKTKKGVFIRFFESNPAIEIFFRYYFEYTTAAQTNDGLKDWLKEKVGYKVRENYFAKNPLHDVFCRNHGSLEDAISNSIRSVVNREPDNYVCCFTEVGSMIKLLTNQEE